MCIGSIGGAIYMNAGAYDGEMKQVVVETLCLDRDGNLITLKGNEHNFFLTDTAEYRMTT